MKYVTVLLILLTSCFAQTRAQLKAELKAQTELGESQAQFIQMLIDANAELRSQLDEANANNAGFVKMIAEEESQIAKLRNTNEILKIANASLSSVRTTVVPMPIFEQPQVIHNTTVIRQEAPYQPPVWDSPVHCSGYEIPTPGLTLTYGNCR